MAPSPCDMTLPAFTRESVVRIAWVESSAAASGSAAAGRYPSTSRCGARLLTALTRMPSALRSSAERLKLPCT